MTITITSAKAASDETAGQIALQRRNLLFFERISVFGSTSSGIGRGELTASIDIVTSWLRLKKIESSLCVALVAIHYV